ncbi:hypothetical protein TeGR_g14433 [Tetraparma gracilis]|uniref:Pseudouridine synthase RsuA/RluA-like domain-containing protein n=1 Tax=Tetraparma gracilis TaxID=2962635 RepID=A0ABQ6MFJ2_9STRA|nr:hypothetical protein TeGR_g14433 [Tetraparma gracilis]
MRLDTFVHAHLQSSPQKKGDRRLKAAQKLIRSGAVSVSSTPVLDPKYQFVPSLEPITISPSSAPLPATPPLLYIAHKPAGCVCALSDDLHPPLLSKLPPLPPGLSPVGRLDLDTTGAILLTSDGGLQSLLLFPTSRAEKVYRVTLPPARPLPPDAAERVAAGLTLPDGTGLLPASLVISSPTSCLLTLREGLFHQVKRMVAALGSEVASLHRVSFAGVDVEGLAAGEVRALTEAEVRERVVPALPADRRGRRELPEDVRKRRRGE